VFRLPFVLAAFFGRLALFVVGIGCVIRRWAVAEMRGYVLVLALVNLLLANAIVWTVILFWP